MLSKTAPPKPSFHNVLTQHNKPSAPNPPPPSARQCLSFSWAVHQSLGTASREEAAGWKHILSFAGSYKRQASPRVQIPLRMVWEARGGQCQGAKATSAGRAETEGESSELRVSSEESQERGEQRMLDCGAVHVAPPQFQLPPLSLSLSLFSPTHSHHSCTADSREREVDVFYLNWSPQTVFLEQEEKTRPDNCHKFSPIFTCLFLSHAIPWAVSHERA